MNQMIEKFVNVSLQVRSYCADLVYYVSYIDSKYGTAIMIATPYVILGSMFIWKYVKRCWASNKRSLLTRSRSLAKLHGGDLALESFMKLHKVAHTTETTLDRAPDVLFKNLLEKKHVDYSYMQKYLVATLEMSGKEEKAIDVLEKAKTANENNSLEAYEIEMLLVEMLIYKGDFDKAFACECLKHEDITDARRPFYKAILHMMFALRKKEEEEEHLKEARKCWEEFTYIREHMLAPKENYIKISFEEFKERVIKLKCKICRISVVAKKKETNK